MKDEGRTLKAARTKALAVLAVLSAWALPATAAVYLPIPDGELLRRSDAVVVAQSLGSRPATPARGETWTRFAAETVLSGTVGSTFDVAVLGGPVADGRTLVVPDVPAFDPGAMYLLFLRARADGSFAVTEQLLGAFDVVGAKGRSFATRMAMRKMKGPGDSIRELSAFSAWIGGGGAGEASYVRSVDPALLYAVTGGKTPLWNSGWGTSRQQARWNPFPVASVIASNTSTSIVGQSGVAGTGGGLNYEFYNAINWWNRDPLSDIKYTRGPDRFGGFDPYNLPDRGEVVVFLNDLSQFVTPVIDCDKAWAGVIAMGGWLTDGSVHSYKRTPWGTILAGIGWMRRIDCPAGALPSNVFENATTAVLGNSFGLTTNPQTANEFDTYIGDEQYAVMNAIQDVNRGAGLGSDDLDAVCFLYGACDPMNPAPDRPVAGFTLFPTPAVKGGNTSFRDLTTGEPTLWSWEWREGAGGSGALAGTSTARNPVFVFPKVGFYQGKVAATNAKGTSIATGPVEVRTNLAGILTAPPPTMAGAPATVGLAFSGKADQALIQWGDGQTTTLTNPVSPISETHSYASPGIFYTAVKLTDADRTADATPTQWLKVFDLPTGFTIYPKNCNGPERPGLVAPVSAEPTHGILLTWGAPSDYLYGSDTYVIDVANDPGFTGESYWQYTSVVPFLIVPPDSPARGVPGGHIFARVATHRQCASVIPSEFSDVSKTLLLQPPPGVTTTPQRLYLSYFPGTPAPALKLTFLASYFTFATANVTLTPPAFLNVSSRTFALASETTRDVTVTFPQATLSTPGAYSGSIKVEYEQDTFYLPVLLVVQAGGPYAAAPSGPPAAATVTIPNRPDPLLIYSAPSGQTPKPASVSVQVTPAPGASDQWFLDLSEVPGWVNVAGSCGGGENDSNCALFRFPSSGKLKLDLSVNRATRSASHRSSPQYFAGIFSAARSAADTKAGLPMIDMEGVTVKTNAAADLQIPPPHGSFVVPTVSQGSGMFNSRFASDGWIKNASSDPISVSLYFTPEGVSGTTDPGVTKATWPIKPGQAFHLARLMDSFFAHGDGTGRMEVRSDNPRAIVLQARTEAQSQDDPLKRFGTDIPIPLWGSGAVLGGFDFLIPGVVQNAQKRTNLILAETAGQPAVAEVTVRDEEGRLLGKVSGVEVPPYGKIQLNQVVLTAAPTASLPNGSIAVRVTSGAGHVYPLATIVDNVANSFYAVHGRLMSQSGAPSSIVIPMAVKSTGLFNTYFSTSIFAANGTDEQIVLALTYYYIDQDAADLTRKAFTSVVIPARGCLQLSKGGDAIPTLFGQDGRTYGWIEVKGDVGKAVISAGVNAQIDPTDASKGVRIAQVPAVDINSEFAFDITSDAHHAMGLERSEQKRTNLILVSINSLPTCNVRLLLLDAEGNDLGRKEYFLQNSQYLQVNDIFGPEGFNVPAGPYRDMVIETSAVCGTGRVLGFVTINDNISRNPEIIVLRPAGPVPLF